MASRQRRFLRQLAVPWFSHQGWNTSWLTLIMVLSAEEDTCHALLSLLCWAGPIWSVAKCLDGLPTSVPVSQIPNANKTRRSPWVPLPTRTSHLNIMIPSNPATVLLLPHLPRALAQTLRCVGCGILYLRRRRWGATEGGDTAWREAWASAGKQRGGHYYNQLQIPQRCGGRKPIKTYADTQTHTKSHGMNM